MKKKVRNGFTLIELIMVIIIASAILVPLSVVVVESLRRTLLPEHFTMGSCLLEGKAEEVTNRRFSDIEAMIGGAGESGTFTGNFSDYSYSISAPYYVDPSDLNTQVAGPTDYLRIQITISRTGFPSVSAVTLVTDN